MYTLLILFLVSLLGIMVMIGRKHLLIQKGVVFEEKGWTPDPEYFEDLKVKTMKKLGRLGFILLVILVRVYVKVSDVLKEEYRRSLEKVRNVQFKSSDDGAIKIKVQKENKILKMASQYKKKIRRIKDRVRKENS
jgi:hypothetical protein